MKRLLSAASIFLFLLFTANGAVAEPFPITDVRALGMGGAFVAAGEGIGAVQHNPALLGKNTTVGMVFPEIIARVEDHLGLVDIIDDLNNLGPEDPDASVILEKLESGERLNVQGNASAGLGFGFLGLSAGVSYSRHVYGMALPYNISTADLTNEDNNRLEMTAMDSSQIILSGATSLGSMVFGANLRQIDATMYSQDQWLFDDPDTGILDFSEGAETDERATAIDAGLFVNLLPMLDFGIAARDLNGPELGEVEFDPRYRAGVALNLPALTVVADLDVNDASLEGNTEYREWALGAEVDLAFLAIRAGMSKNTGLSGAPTLFHAGMGFGPLDIGAAMADGGDYYMAGLNLAVGF